MRRIALRHDRSGLNSAMQGDVTDFHADEITTPQLAIKSEIEEG